MNNIIKMVFVLMVAYSFVACSPIEKDFGTGDVVTSTDQLNVTITPVMYKTYKTNKYKVHCTSPVICKWTTTASYISNDTTVMILGKGSQNIKLTALAADGSILTKTYSVTVDSLYYPVPPQWGYLCGASARTWVWAVDNTYSGSKWIWGNGGLTDTAPAWWGRTASDAASDGIDINGTMNFSLDAATFTKVESGVTSTGSFSFDMTPSTTTKGIGTLTINGTTILHGISQNDDKKVVYKFNIIKLTNDELILEYSTESNTYEGWYWVFKRQGFSY
ncbi:MAG: hypothetical protein H6Q17_281 [Bacteroidetes bacterium]|nr:hypothetical protein [Bacteroidota bacterium]